MERATFMAVDNIKSYHPVWGLGFRPFFLFGSIAAIVLMLLWVKYLLFPGSLVPSSKPMLWHAHEMLFGFTGAIIVGFLLTASQNWSGIKGIRGQPLRYLFYLWLMARILPFIGLSTLFTAVIDLLFFPLSMWALKPQLSQSSQKRNHKFLVLMTLLLIANVFTQLGLTDIAPQMAPYGVRMGIATVLLIIMVITGRIIPFFTKKVISNSTLKKYPILETTTFVISGLFFIVYIGQFDSFYLSLIAIPAFVCHFIRLFFWRPFQSLKIPILAILYAGYGWMVLGFFLQGMSLVYFIFPGTILHAWTAGTIGILIYGMVSRVSLGHTGRKIESSLGINIGYLLINFAVFLRVIMPTIWPGSFQQLIALSGTMWAMAFMLLIWVYTPILTRPRLDGKEG